MSHIFLSDAWFDAVEGLRAEQPATPAGLADATINITVTDGPDGDIDVHLSAGTFDRGHADDAPTKLTVPYETAKKLFIEGDQSAAMQAFMSGKVKVEGDISQVMALQMAPPTPEQTAFQTRLADLTS